jgi:hypothetical protein
LFFFGGVLIQMWPSMLRFASLFFSTKSNKHLKIYLCTSEICPFLRQKSCENNQRGDFTIIQNSAFSWVFFIIESRHSSRRHSSKIWRQIVKDQHITVLTDIRHENFSSCS